jgi:serine/threonine-protein kinase BUR1
MKILHRDMKAANLLINNQGILKIADFGLARIYEEAPPKRDYTNCVVTRWYRPPELLLGEKKYGPSVDMWGVGCVFAEMMRGKPLIEGRSDMDQLIRIFQLCGSPTQETMPGYDQLPAVIDDVKVNLSEHHERILEREIYDFLSRVGVGQVSAQLAVDLLSKFMLLDPRKRLSAIDALDHEYFSANPLPSRPQDLPAYEASHELTRRKREMRARAPRGLHQADEHGNRDHQRRKYPLEGDMPSTWSGGNRMTREDSRGFRRDEAQRVDRYRHPQVDSWIASRDGRPAEWDRDREREKDRQKSPRSKLAEPEVKYGRR